MAEGANQSAKFGSTNDGALPFLSILQSDPLWEPHRAAACVAAHNVHSIAPMIQVNRKLADALREVVQREQDALLDLSDRMMKDLAAGQKSEGEAAAAPPLSYQTALEGARDFGQAAVEAQNKSFEALCEYARAAIDNGRRAASDFKTTAQ